MFISSNDVMRNKVTDKVFNVICTVDGYDNGFISGTFCEQNEMPVEWVQQFNTYPPQLKEGYTYNSVGFKRIIFESGAYYVGWMKDEMLNGYGKYTYADG